MEFMKDINSKIDKIGELQSELWETIEEATNLIEEEIKNHKPDFKLNLDDVYNYFDDASGRPELVSAQILKYILEHQIDSYSWSYISNKTRDSK